MNCEEIKNLMDAYLDGELDPITSQKVEQHLPDCPKCEQAYKMETAMAHAISQAAPYYKAPLELRERIQVSLREAVGTPTRRGSAAAGPLPVRRPEGVRRGVFFDMLAGFLQPGIPSKCDAVAGSKPDFRFKR